LISCAYGDGERELGVAKELIRAKGASYSQNETYIEVIGIEAIGKSDITLGEVATT